MEKGYIHVYTGNGKGKTTAALGVALRTLGCGRNVAIIQFIKSKGFKYNEINALEIFSKAAKDGAKILAEQFGKGCCIHSAPDKADIEGAKAGLDFARQCIKSGEWDLVILDEINIALWLKLISSNDVIDIIESRPPHVEVILTGRHALPEIIEIADLVTEMKELKHYYKKGILAREGIDK